ncbi:hypothetical protein C1Y63_11360 [Corynebacterium sp. 13CS0277]|uniref:hypothetical protein n=1 Tax=Corynebacterium sp. 13CS0277 TaxID=2071994 RepID=UPI000D024B28|nr:hypothetical protein [Corynebacterium sp. 13CS0277]PRQ10478.1 hypothetical protein C1Y63_11360 [Corynebacterium sp. 13CS0277]
MQDDNTTHTVVGFVLLTVAVVGLFLTGGHHVFIGVALAVWVMAGLRMLTALAARRHARREVQDASHRVAPAGGEAEGVTPPEP